MRSIIINYTELKKPKRIYIPSLEKVITKDDIVELDKIRYSSLYRHCQEMDEYTQALIDTEIPNLPLPDTYKCILGFNIMGKKFCLNNPGSEECSVDCIYRTDSESFANFIKDKINPYLEKIKSLNDQHQKEMDQEFEKLYKTMNSYIYIAAITPSIEYDQV